MPTAREFWDRRARVYDAQVCGLYAEAYRKTTEDFLRYLKPEDTVLDFACGTGNVTLTVAPAVKCIRGIDISGEMVRRAQAKACAQGVQNAAFTQLDIFDESLALGSFDVVMACNVLLYLEDRAEVFARIRALLKSGGRFLSVSDCLGENWTRERVRKWVEYKTGRRPYVAFDTMASLEAEVAAAGFAVLERENLFPAPPNLFLATRKK